ncbi:MAG: glycosyltransferase family 4 protein [Chitinophagaceae bacterium]
MQQKFSVVQIIDMLNVGGAERVLVTIANLLHEHGHKIAVITTVKPGILASQLHKEISLINLNRKWKWNFFKMYRLINIAKQFDVVHIHSSHNLRYFFLAATLFRFNKPIFFQEHHGNVINEKIPWHKKYIYPKTIFIAVSKQLAEWALIKLHIPAKNVFILHSTVPKPNAVKTFRKINTDKQIIIVSNFLRNKNIHFAIEVFEELQKNSDKKISLTIIGQKYDEIYFQFIRQIITQKNLQSHINIIQNCTDIQKLLPDYDFALHTSESESGPLVLIEYLAQGLPFITFDTGEVAEQIKSAIPEFIMYSFNKIEWVERIKKLLLNSSAELSNKLINLYEIKFSPQAYYKKCIIIYEAGLRIKK